MPSYDRFLNPLNSLAASHAIVINAARPIHRVEWLPRGVDVLDNQYVALALGQWSYDGENYSSINADSHSPTGSTLLLILNHGRSRQSLHVNVTASIGQVTCLKWWPEHPTIHDPYLSYLTIETSQWIVIIFRVQHGAPLNR